MNDLGTSEWLQMRYLEARAVLEAALASNDLTEVRNWLALRVLADEHGLDAEPWCMRVHNVFIPSVPDCSGAAYADVTCQEIVALSGVRVQHAATLIGTLTEGNRVYGAAGVPLTELVRLPTFIHMRPGTHLQLRLSNRSSEPLATHVDFVGYALRPY